MLGFNVGGANDIGTFIQNIKNNFMPKNQVLPIMVYIMNIILIQKKEMNETEEKKMMDNDDLFIKLFCKTCRSS